MINSKTFADAFPITPSANTAINAASIYVGGAGSVILTTEAGNVVTFTAVPAGTILPVRAAYVSNASTATSLVGLRG